ncbi:MAG: FHA domain-containing protein [Sedimentisphaerales bacterium]|nr:FHA domain-containing protein [Sedimentisphaerales bacterium]
MPVFDIYDEKPLRRIKVEADRVTIGRTADNNVIISERIASRQHCEIRLDTLPDNDSSGTDGAAPDEKKSENPQPDSAGTDLYDVILPEEGDSEMGILVPEDTEEETDSREQPPTPLPGTNKYYVLRDLQSRNGTILNEQRIKEPTPLRNGDEISIGKSAIRFWFSAESIDPNAPDLPVIDLTRHK